MGFAGEAKQCREAKPGKSQCSVPSKSLQYIKVDYIGT